MPRLTRIASDGRQVINSAPFCAVAALAALTFAGCSGGGEAGETAADEPETLQLTPGTWAANEERASFANDSGALRATMLCDPETQELVLETPGDFTADAPPSMAVRIGDMTRSIEGVIVRQDVDGPVKVARMPVRGRVAESMRGSPRPMTIQTEGGAPLMMQTGAALSDFVDACAVAAGSGAPDGGQ